MSLFTVTINGNTYEVYGGAPACLVYLGASVGDEADAFAALGDGSGTATAGQLKCLVGATRYLDRVGWQGAPTTPAVNGTTLQFPRTNLIDRDGNAIDPSTIPTDFVNAVFEMTAILASDATAQSAQDQGNNIRSMQAGSARLENFRPTSFADGNATVLPYVVQQLVGRWTALASPAVASASAPTVGGINPHSSFTPWSKRNVWWPF